ncbi:MAG TPA: hypothetical protein PLR32_00490 [candidate division Zixibacteria bacterium]|nr:hypothetical protein [candidate division Zixibacteria bacterium]MDD4916805.1 hypothetical protein [candidate division Zixibacteria bacterium]MDM7973134.1 hypothetical protein [candidate division Zixibacteria bacterium]HOD65193.1 hypothetical protein [candidate division Zixibacteria bacterium]HOZ08980.1 hypothetical protein [candidate division Zixibacteria bacterium]
MSVLVRCLAGLGAVVLAAAAALIGCAPPPPVADQPTVPRGFYDEVWVEPRIVHADSVFTLIRADRKDSVFVRTNEVDPNAWAPALEFKVAPDTCFVSVTLHFLESDRPALPLLARYLPKGYYKLTVNNPLRFGETVYRGSCLLGATVCGRRQTVPIVR